MKSKNRSSIFFATMMIATALATTHFGMSHAKAAEAQPTTQPTAAALPALDGDPTTVTVSGVSAGAFVAGQLQVAYSSSIHGVGMIAGGPWNCSQDLMNVALTSCMATPALINTTILSTQLKSMAVLHLVDPLKNMKQARAYFYNSDKDALIKPPMREKNQKFWAHWIPAASTKIEHSIPSAHGMPTLNYGIDCATSATPFLLKCDFDSAGAMLRHLYSSLALKRAPMSAANLIPFSQDEFGKDSHLDASGWVYVPQVCRAQGVHCPVHMALHGCGMSLEIIKDAYATNAGYNEWAEGSGIIIIYPQVKKSLLNPNGCFDWFGYTGPHYADKNGSQMQALKAMLDRATAHPQTSAQ